MTTNLAALEAQLNDLDRDTRRTALAGLAEAVAAGTVSVPPETGAVNVHFHTFFSFNAEDYSPSRIVWEAKKAGLSVAGSVDFDVLDAMDEMFEAGEVLKVRTVASLETRVFVEAYADRDLNSPGEAGVYYFMGSGFTRLPEAGSPARAMLDRMRAGARARNDGMLKRLAPHLAPLAIDYEADVLPLTPAGNATERHMLAAYDRKARELYPDGDALSAFWAEKLSMDAAEVAALLDDTAALRNTVRKKLMKRGGPGYVQPDATTFPPIREVASMILDAEAIPCATWLDGTTDGEADAERLLDDFMKFGCLALNIIPDRNWNISDEATRTLKVRKLNEIVEAARARDLIFSVGTEMNNYGLKFVDDFDAPALKPFAADFLRGALVLYGHTLLQRAAGKGRTSAWAKTVFGDDRAAANDFYHAVGRTSLPPREAREALAKLTADAPPEDIRKAVST